jgi:hypothetical protein
MATANKPLGTPCLTAGYADAELVRQINKSMLGMAHFAATGLFGAQCKDCAHYGVWQQVRNQAGDVIKTIFHRGRCAKSEAWRRFSDERLAWETYHYGSEREQQLSARKLREQGNVGFAAREAEP